MEDQKFEIGERVWYQPLGWGVVHRINSEALYPVCCRFESAYIFWRATGELIRGCGIQSLFRANSGVLEFDTTELPDWPKDHPIWVRDFVTDDWSPRHLSHFAEGKAVCHLRGCTSHSDPDGVKTRWKYYTDVDPDKSIKNE